MRSTIHNLAVLLAPAALQLAAAASSVPRQPPSQLLSSSAASKCDPYFEEVCESACMYAGDTCCNDGTSESCMAGYYCTTTSCCLRGEVCDEPPVPGSETSALSELPGFTPTWEIFPTSMPDDFSSVSDNVSTYSFSFMPQPTPSPAEGAATTTEETASVGAAATSASTPTSAASPPPPPGSTNAAAGQFVACGKAVAGLAVAVAGLLI